MYKSNCFYLPRFEGQKSSNLMLRKGKWKEKQVVPEHWVEEMITQRTSYLEAQKNAPILKKDGLDLGCG
ncbi:MAG: hypothetical protein ABJG41_11935 [Cyclobacteriaceae bacterium]